MTHVTTVLVSELGRCFGTGGGDASRLRNVGLGLSAMCYLEGGHDFGRLRDYADVLLRSKTSADALWIKSTWATRIAHVEGNGGTRHNAVAIVAR